MKNMNTFMNLCCIFGLVFLINEVDLEKIGLKQLHIVFRHGERSPTETYKLDPYINYTWLGGLGQLTNRGKYQMYVLGQKLRQWYSDFVPKYYFPVQVKILSSYSDRCLMSAQLFLAGFFPPKDSQVWNKNLLWQPIPVRYTPRNQDNLIVMRAKCPRYDAELIKAFSSEKIQIIDKENKELYENLTKFTGGPIEGISDVEFLYNTLEIEQLNNLTLPDWIKYIDLNKMKTLAATALATYTDTDYMKRMKGGVFINKTISDFKKSEPILYLYSGHDVTLVNILRNLEDKLLKPDFGASLAIEYYNNTEIKIVYRNGIESEPRYVNLSSCGSPCYLRNFEIMQKHLLPVDWELECSE